MDYQYDLVVIGAGSGGVRAARMASQSGARVAIVEKSALGGTCVNVGCVPKKLFVYGSEFSNTFDAAAGFGWTVEDKKFDWPTLRDNKTREILRLNGIYKSLLENAGVDIIHGTAALVSPHQVKVFDDLIESKHILVATGSTPFIPDFPGSELAINSDDFFYMDSLPQKAIIVGGGYIAVEFAGILNGLGVETHLVYRGSLFLRGFDDDVRSVLRDELTRKGIHLHFNTSISSLTQCSDGVIEAKTNTRPLVANAVLYATGRRPLIDGLNLDVIGVDTEKNGFIKVDDHYSTSVPSIFALGDVIGGMQLTPIAIAEAMVLVDNLFYNKQCTLDYSNIATAVFCQPNIGTVGLTEAQARELYGDVLIFKSSFKAMKHTLSGLEEKIFMKLIVQKSTDIVVGVHMVGPDAGEIIQGIAIALKCGATKAQFDSTIGIHPTAAEEFVTMRSFTS